MNTIKIDDTVLEYLKSKADPFNDTPNSVLRRELGIDKFHNNRKEIRKKDNGTMQSDEFVRKVILEHYGYKNRPQKVGRFRYLFNLNGKHVYFQNFNEPTNNLWYRIRSNALDKLRENVDSDIILTYPIEKLFYIISVKKLKEKLTKNNLSKEDIEVNIDPNQDYWRELNWKLERFTISKPQLS